MLTNIFFYLILFTVDVILDDVFRLLSLAFLTVGLNRSAPATFASLSTVQSLLDHLEESKVYSDNDTVPIRKRLEEIQQIIEDDSESESPEVIQLIKQKLNVSFKTLKEVEDSMKAVFDSGLNDMLRKLVALRREILSIGSKPKFNVSSLEPIKEKLQTIEAGRDEDGNFVSGDGRVVAEAQGVLNGLLDECHNLVKDFSASSKTSIPPTLVPLYDQLVELKSRLENLLVTHRWTMRETDLYTYQKKLDEIDAQRSDGGALGKIIKEDPKASSILLYLLRRCYAILYKLLESSQPVSEALIPMHNQLSTVRRCLLEVQRNGGLSSVRELYPYQMKLASIDDLRVDGKFMVGDSIPEGQGMLNALLSECFEICHELKVEMEERQYEKEDGEGGDEEEEEDRGIQFTEGAGDREPDGAIGGGEGEDDSDGVSLQKIPSYK